MEPVNNPRHTPYFSCIRIVLVGMIIACCSGCWEEIHYTPRKSSLAKLEESPAEEQTEKDDSIALIPTKVEVDGKESLPEATSTEVTETVQVESADELSPTEATSLEAAPVEAPEDSTIDEVFGDQETETSTETDLFLTPEGEDSGEPALREAVAVLLPSRTAWAAWRASSRWSYAAAIHAKGLGEATYGELLQQARDASDLLEIELPSFPTFEDEDRQSEMISFLLDVGRMQLAEKLSRSYAPEYAALAELAIKTHVLLLVYTPKSTHLDPIVGAIRRAAENSTLPLSLWSPLVELLEQRAPFSEVKAAVMQLHLQVGDYLSGLAEE